MNSDMVVCDVFLRYGKGPVQHFRAWDRELFIRSQVDQGERAKEPYVVSVANADDYARQRRKK